MQIAVPSIEANGARTKAWLEREVISLFAMLFLLFLCAPMFQADRSPLGSDESLYLSEALNIAEGRGLVYATGEPIVHRAPLYPAMLAGVAQLTGLSLDDAYVLPKIAILVNLVLVFLLARALFGTWAAIVTGALAGAAPYLRGMGTTLYLDGTETAFILATFLTLWYAARRNSFALYAVAGALLGLAFLVKESAVLFLPLPLAMALLFERERGWRMSLLAWFGGFAAITAWWWLWVFAETGHIFLAGDAGSKLTLLVLGGGLIAGVAAWAYFWRSPATAPASRATRSVAAAIVFIWVVAFFYGLETRAYSFDNNYVCHIPEYFTSVFASNVHPAVLVGTAWLWAMTLMARGNKETTLLSLGLLLFLPMTLVVADRNLSLRDLLPAVYLSYVVAGGLAAWLVEWGARLDSGQGVRMMRGAGIVLGAIVVGAVVLRSGDNVTQAQVSTYQDDWHNQFSQQVANWLETNAEPGARVMSTRLYYSHVYFLTEGKYPIFQMPTVEASIGGSGADAMLLRRSSLFRWEDARLPSDPTAESWLYLTRYPSKGYLIGLAEDDLLADLKQRQIEYVVVSTADAGFSSPSMLEYFDKHPAFKLAVRFSAEADGASIYTVDRSKLTPGTRPMQVTRSAFDYLAVLFGDANAATKFLNGSNPNGFVTNER